MEENKINNKIDNKIGFVVAGIAIIVLIVIFVVVSLLNDKDKNVEKIEFEQVTAYSNKMTEAMEKAKTMELDEAKSFVVSEIYDTNELYGGNDSVDYLSNQLLQKTLADNSASVDEFIVSIQKELDNVSSSLNDGVDELLNGSNKNVLKSSITMRSNTVCSDKRIDDKYCVDKLNARVYISDANSDKWAVVIHGYMMSGSLMYSAVGNMYAEQGYNVLAPDLRGFGSSDGSVAMGYLESLDVYDWIKDLNQNWNNKERYGVNVAPESIVVHGISLGGATTLQLATNPDIKLAANEPYTSNLTDLHVKGFVDDCGYTSMSGIITGMLSMGELVDLTSILSSLNIDLDDFMAEISNIAKLENIPGFEDFNIESLENIDFSELYNNLERFTSSYNNLQDEINKYINSNGTYQIPGFDQDKINEMLKDYLNYVDNTDIKDKANSIIQDAQDKIDNINPDDLFNNFNPGDLSNIMGASVNHNNNDFSLDGLVAKALMNLVGVGLTEDNYAKYSNVFSEGREFVNGSKVMIIHGTTDTTVPHSNADVVEKNVNPGILVHKWDAELQPHAFIVVGIKKDEYKGLVKNYLNCLNDSSCVQITK